MNITEIINPKRCHWLLKNLTEDIIPHDERERFNMTLIKKTIQHYIKCNGNNKVQYVKKDEMNMLRDYGGICIQNMPTNIRGFLCEESMTDIDMVNCHPTIIWQLCKKYNIECSILQEYCLNRKQLIAEGKADKIKVIKSINDYKPLKDCSYFMTKLDVEIKHIQKELVKILDFKLQHDMAIKNAETKKTKNVIGMFMSNLATSFEVKFLHSCIDFFNNQKIRIGVLMYDGIMIYGNHYKNIQLLTDLSQLIQSEFGFDIQFNYKEHDNGGLMLPEDFMIENEKGFKNKQYTELKNMYENEYGLAFIESLTVYSYKNNGVYRFYTKDAMAQVLKPIRLDEASFLPSFQFFNCWLDDINRKTYTDIGCFPHDVECPPGILNLWTGFQCSNLKESYDETIIQPILNHIRILMGNDDKCYEFMLKWLANLFQYPSSTSVMVFMGSEEGAGKGSFMDLMSEMMGGDKFFLCEDLKEDMFGTFNGHLKNTVLVNIDEPDFKSTIGFFNKIKSMITRKTISIHDKGMKKYDIPHIMKYIATSNELHAFKISKNDRRFFIVESSNELMGNDDYFRTFNELIKNKQVQYSFWKYLMDYPTKKQITKNDIPMTKLKEEAILLSRDSAEDFAEQMEGSFTSMSLYISFKSFMTANGIDCRMSKKSFELRFNRYLDKYGITKRMIDRVSHRGFVYYKGKLDETIFCDITPAG